MKYGPRFTVSGHKRWLVDIRGCGTCSVEHVYTEQVVWCGGGTRFGTRFESEESEQPCGLARLVWVVHGSFELKFNLIKKTVF